MVPPVGDGTGPINGQMKHSPKMKATITAGTITPSELRQRPSTLAAAASSAAGATPATTRSLGRSAIADPWIEYRVQHVGGQVGEHDDHREHEHDALDHRDVAVVDRLQQLVPDAGNPEDVLDHDREPEQGAEVQRDHGDQSEQ